MGDISGPLAYLLLSWGIVTVALVALLVYRGALGTKEDDELYINKAEETLMAAEQRVLVQKMDRLGRPILALGVVSAALFVMSASVWVWIGLHT